MDYESIAKGRRRNWDKLKPDEVRRRERAEARAKEQAEKEAAGEAPKKKGFQELRAEIMAQAMERDRLEFRQHMRKVTFAVSIFVGALVVTIAVGAIVSRINFRAIVSDVSRFEQMIAEKKKINDLSSPIAAWATWRSAWMARDVKRVIGTFSPAYLKRVSRDGNAARLANDYQYMDSRNDFAETITLAVSFEDPELLRIPRRPYRDGELALLQSKLITVTSEAGGEDGAGERRFIMAISYNAAKNTWHFADVREAPYFNVRWKTESDIKPLRMGPEAPRWDERGEVIGGKE